MLVSDHVGHPAHGGRHDRHTGIYRFEKNHRRAFGSRAQRKCVECLEVLARIGPRSGPARALAHTEPARALGERSSLRTIPDKAHDDARISRVD
jgi:hypothetical protein